MKFFLATLIWFCSHAFSYAQTTCYWRGYGSNDNIDQWANWWTGNPSSGDNLYFDNTGSGSDCGATGRKWAYSNYGSGSWFGEIITFNCSSTIKLYGDNTYAMKFENRSSPDLFEISNSTIGNREGFNLEINPVGSGGVLVSSNVISLDHTGEARTLKVYGGYLLTINAAITDVDGTGGKLELNGPGTVELKGANAYSGATIINDGTIRLMRSGGGTLPSGNTVVINNTGTLRVSSNQTLSSISLNPGGTLIVDAGVTLELSSFSSNGSITNNGTILVNGIPLSVTFSSFTGSIRNGGAHLNWKTYNEFNVAYYEVEKSSNGRDFRSLQKTLSTGRSVYQTLDDQLNAGTNYYRVKAVDNNGKSTYSKILRLDYSAVDNNIRIYPNPSRGELNLGLNIGAGNYQIRMINALGQTVFQQPLNHEGGSRSMPLALPKLNAGIYQVEVSGGVQKFVRSVRIE
jgi:autotransporter-associated beta strand protein